MSSNEFSCLSNLSLIFALAGRCLGDFSGWEKIKKSDWGVCLFLMFFYQQTAEGAEERQYHSREVFTVRTSISEHFSVRRKRQQESTKNTWREIKGKKRKKRSHWLQPEVVWCEPGVVDAQHDGTFGDDGILDLKTSTEPQKKGNQSMVDYQ